MPVATGNQKSETLRNSLTKGHRVALVTGSIGQIGSRSMWRKGPQLYPVRLEAGSADDEKKYYLTQSQSYSAFEKWQKPIKIPKDLSRILTNECTLKITRNDEKGLSRTCSSYIIIIKKSLNCLFRRIFFEPTCIIKLRVNVGVS